MTNNRTDYQAPKLALVGSLEQLTQGSHTGNNLDKSFPTDTPAANLTFS